MNYPQIMLRAYREIIPNWDAMTEEERAKIESDPKMQGRISGAANAMLMKNVSDQAVAQRAEMAKRKSIYSGPM
jgi:hypothetical protein